MVKAAYTYSKAIDQAPYSDWTEFTLERAERVLSQPCPGGSSTSLRTSSSQSCMSSRSANEKKWATSGTSAAILGGWQLNGVFSAYDGTSVYTLIASDASLNMPGNAQTADQIKPDVEIFGNDRRRRDVSRHHRICAASPTSSFGNVGRNIHARPRCGESRHGPVPHISADGPVSAAVPRGGVQPEQHAALREPGQRRQQLGLRQDFLDATETMPRAVAGVPLRLALPVLASPRSCGRGHQLVACARHSAPVAGPSRSNFELSGVLVKTVQTWAAVLVAMRLAAAPAIAQPRTEPELPALPDIALETLPADARTALETALADARRSPRDAAAVGRLGITLQAWEQWEAAHLAYLRAQVLAPTSADWRHGRDGVAASGAAGRGGRRVSEGPEPVTRAATGAGADGRSAVLTSVTSTRARERMRRWRRSRPLPLWASLAWGGSRRVKAGTPTQSRISSVPSRSLPEFGEAYHGLAQSLRALERRDEARAALEQHRAHGTRWPAIDDPLSARVVRSRRPTCPAASRPASGRGRRCRRRHRSARSRARIAIRRSRKRTPI